MDDEQAQIDREFRELRELVTIPYLPPLSEGQKLPKKALEPYTLVLDLDETLIHFEVDEDVNPEEEEPGYYLIRPGAVRFLNELSEYYEIVVFTAAMPDVSHSFLFLILHPFFVFHFSMPTGSSTTSTELAASLTASIASTPHLMKTMLSKTYEILAETSRKPS